MESFEWFDNAVIRGPETERIDKRRSREYGRKVMASVEFPDRPWNSNSYIENLDRFMSEGIKGSGSYQNTIFLSAFVAAEKPSLIVASEKAIEASGLTVEAVREAIVKAKAAAEREAEIKDTVKEVNSLADHFATEAGKEATKVVRWKQRLAALTAELKAEQKVQLAKVIKEVKQDGITYSDTEERARDVAIKLACEHAEEFLPGTGIGFPRTPKRLEREDLGEAIEAHLNEEA